jgi:hypothetical protein
VQSELSRLVNVKAESVRISEAADKIEQSKVQQEFTASDGSFPQPKLAPRTCPHVMTARFQLDPLENVAAPCS